MKTFPVGAVLTLTTDRKCVDNEVVYDFLIFLTGNSDSDLPLAQIPRAADEAMPWIATQFPQLMPDNPEMKELIADLAIRLDGSSAKDVVACKTIMADWVTTVCKRLGFPPVVTVYAMPAKTRFRVEPVEVATAVGEKETSQ